jgi:hypothetical protein
MGRRCKLVDSFSQVAYSSVGVGERPTKKAAKSIASYDACIKLKLMKSNAASASKAEQTTDISPVLKSAKGRELKQVTEDPKEQSKVQSMVQPKEESKEESKGRDGSKGGPETEADDDEQESTDDSCSESEEEELEDSIEKVDQAIQEEVIKRDDTQ